MTYLENAYVCLAAPLLVAILCLRGTWRRALIFLLTGMTCCVMSAYISTFLADVLALDAISVSHEVTPAVEEIIKFLPIFFYVVVFEPDKNTSINGILVIAVGFATFENVCFMTSYGTRNLLPLFIRGFGTGAMHVVCGVMVAIGLYLLWEQTWLRVIGVFAVLGSAVTFHAIFNIVISEQGVSLWIGSAIPLAMVIVSIILLRKRRRQTGTGILL